MHTLPLQEGHSLQTPLAPYLVCFAPASVGCATPTDAGAPLPRVASPMFPFSLVSPAGFPPHSHLLPPHLPPSRPPVLPPSLSSQATGRGATRRWRWGTSGGTTPTSPASRPASCPFCAGLSKGTSAVPHARGPRCRCEGTSPASRPGLVPFAWPGPKQRVPSAHAEGRPRSRRGRTLCGVSGRPLRPRGVWADPSIPDQGAGLRGSDYAEGRQSLHPPPSQRADRACTLRLHRGQTERAPSAYTEGTPHPRNCSTLPKGRNALCLAYTSGRPLCARPFPRAETPRRLDTTWIHLTRRGFTAT